MSTECKAVIDLRAEQAAKRAKILADLKVAQREAAYARYELNEVNSYFQEENNTRREELREALRANMPQRISAALKLDNPKGASIVENTDQVMSLNRLLSFAEATHAEYAKEEARTIRNRKGVKRLTFIAAIAAVAALTLPSAASAAKNALDMLSGKAGHTTTSTSNSR